MATDQRPTRAQRDRQRHLPEVTVKVIRRDDPDPEAWRRLVELLADLLHPR
jgi:hypothetical protein